MCNAKKDLNQQNQTTDADDDVGEVSSRTSFGITERLRSIFGDDDLVLQQRDGVLQWLRALDLQVMGACRADERLKPMLRLNVSGGVAEDHLLAHLSQHFEVPEVGLLARCLCIPLVSLRVGKVARKGSLLCPTATRGSLNLTLLPSSGLRISFVGDDGFIERLAMLSCHSESLVAIEEISADKSGLSFLVKLPDGQVSYFWCSEQSKSYGLELLRKMKDLLRRKPSLAQLTGITESRLDCFGTYLRSYLGATVNNNHPSFSCRTAECNSNTPGSSSFVKPSRPRCINGQAGKPHSLYQASLSPRSNSFKDGAPRNSSSIRSGTRERFRRRGDIHCVFSAVDASTSVTELFRSGHVESNKLTEGMSCSFSLLNSLDLMDKSVVSSSTPSRRLPLSRISTNTSSIFSPHYCCCPPYIPALHYTVRPPHLQISPSESTSLPSLSTILSAAISSSSLSPPTLPFDLADVPPLDFPALLPQPLARVSLPVSSFFTVSSSQQIPIYTPLMCDPIVHIPAINVCSSGQGYLVSASPAISTTIPNPMIQETESVVEKNARETLRLLLSSTQTNPQFMDTEQFMVLGSRGLYSGTRDVETITNSIAAMSLLSLPHTGVGVHNLETRMDGNRDSEGCCCVDDDTNDSTTISDPREKLDAV